jgi:hypothetical protein
VRPLANHAEPQLLDHLFLCAQLVPLLEWGDAFSNSMWITGSVSETRIHAFADRGELMGCST